MHHVITVALLIVGLVLPHGSNAEVSPGSEQNRRSEATPSWFELRELESQLGNSLARIIRLHSDRDSELGVLFEKQKAAANHLDGDMWLEDITLEIQEVASGYETRIEEANGTFDRLSDELDAQKEKLPSVDNHSEHATLGSAE